jgi:rhodanese-related sulfurtransferase/peroxiredoxin
MKTFSWRSFGDVPEISAQELHSLLSGRAPIPQILDVRTLFEWIECRIAGSINVPVTELKFKLASLKMDRDRPVVAICGHAIRSIPSVRLLQADGFEDVYQLQGGMFAWTEAQLPVVEGPSATMEKANCAAPDMKVVLSDGTLTRLSALWQRGTLAVVFTRHFGCPFARRHVTLLRREQNRLSAAGISVVLVSSGSLAQAEFFRRDLAVPFPIICDPDRVLFKKYRVKEMTKADFVSPLILAKTAKVILTEGYGHKFGQGSEMQLGGVFIIEIGGKVRFLHRSADAADHPSSEDILQAAAMLSGRAAVKPKSSIRKSAVPPIIRKPRSSGRAAAVGSNALN